MIDVLTHLPYTLKFVLIFIAGVVLLRIGGKRSIAQLTVPESVLMIAVGTILVQPTANKSEWMAVYGAAILVVGMIFTAYLQIWWPWSRKWLFGTPSVVINNGQMDQDALKRARITEDQLEMRLRQMKVSSVVDVKRAILEASGQLSIVLTENKKAAEKGDVQQVLDELQKLRMQLPNSSGVNPQTATPDLTGFRVDALFQEAGQEDLEDENLKM